MMEAFVAQMPAAFNLTTSRSSNGLAAVVPLYQPMDYLLPSENQSYTFDSAFAQQWPTYIGQRLNTVSMNFQTRNTNSLKTTKGPPSPYDNLPTSMGSSGSQQKPMNASQQPSWQPSQQDFIHTPDYHSPSSTPQLSSIIKQSNIGQQNDRPFKCDQCPQSFNRNHDFKRHKRIHLAVKPFPCGHCEKSFSRKDALQVRSSDLICTNWMWLVYSWK